MLTMVQTRRSCLCSKCLHKLHCWMRGHEAQGISDRTTANLAELRGLKLTSPNSSPCEPKNVSQVDVPKQDSENGWVLLNSKFSQIENEVANPPLTKPQTANCISELRRRHLCSKPGHTKPIPSTPLRRNPQIRLA